MNMQKLFYYAEVCVQFEDQHAIKIGPFVKPASDAEVFLAAAAMSLDVVQTCEPIWSGRMKTLEV